MGLVCADVASVFVVGRSEEDWTCVVNVEYQDQETAEFNLPRMVKVLVQAIKAAHNASDHSQG